MGNSWESVSTTRQACDESSTKVKARLPTSVKSQIEEALRYLDAGNWNNVLQFLRPWGPQGVSLVHVIAYRGDLEMLKRADILNLDLCEKDNLQRCALHYAAEQGHVDVLSWLLERLSKDTKSSKKHLFDQLQQLLRPANAEDAQSYGTYRNKFDVKDKDGRTPLHAAVYGGNLECVRILVKEGFSLASRTTSGETVVDAIFEKIPHPVDFLTEILDQQVTALDYCGNKSILDFHLLIAPPAAQDPELECEIISDLDVVLALINAVPTMKEMEILQHPLVATFLHKKYVTATPLNLIHLLFHIWFVSYLSWQAVRTETMNVQSMIRTVLIPPVTSAGILLLDLIRFMNGTAGVNFNSIRNTFVYRIGILVSMANFIVSLILVNVTLKCRDPSYEYPPVMLHAIGITILLSWANMLLVLDRFPLLAECAYVFFSLLSNVGKILLALVCLIIGFAFGFLVLFSGSGQFSTPWKALAETLVTITGGGYGYDSFLPLEHRNNSTENNQISKAIHIISFTAAGLSIFLILVIVNGVWLMNLTVGSAVSDIQVLLKEGRSRRLMRQADIAFQWIRPGNIISEIFSKPGRFTKIASPTLELDLQSSSWIPWRGVPKDLRKALRHLAVKNFNRDKRSQQGSAIVTNTEESLAAIQASLERIEKRILNSQRQQLAQDTKAKMHRRST